MEVRSSKKLISFVDPPYCCFKKKAHPHREVDLLLDRIVRNLRTAPAASAHGQQAKTDQNKRRGFWHLVKVDSAGSLIY
ncbi:hypothetical protein SAMN06298226_0868 [Nitrosovibrio sp. Nv4]|nr:hypothetical protein SAMN06298226_0868 [Nitrosovibrio sp. Nv4]